MNDRASRAPADGDLVPSLIIEQVGPELVAYFAPQGTEEDMVRLASMHVTIARHPDLQQRFFDLISEGVKRDLTRLSRNIQ